MLPREHLEMQMPWLTVIRGKGGSQSHGTKVRGEKPESPKEHIKWALN